MTDISNSEEVALVVGTGPGLGLSLARCFTHAGMKVGISARNGTQLESWASDLCSKGHTVSAYPCDTTNESNVKAALHQLTRELGLPTLVVYNAGAYMPGKVVDTSVADFEHCWRVGCLGGFIIGKESAKLMLERGSGTLLFTGATASLRGGAGFANLAVGKSGLRALAQSMARELGPRGIHVGHVIIDGQIQSERYAHLVKERPADGLLDPDAIARSYLHLHQQQRSAWTLELDLRPWCEKF